MIVKKERIVEAMQKISSLFIEQIEHGKQTEIVQSNNEIYYSLGQFLSDLERTQRGVHGTATGLRVIADSDKKEVINGMVRYLERRSTVEKAIQTANESIDDKKLERDENNTIKLAETLYSLYYVKRASSHTESYIGSIKNKLFKGGAGKGDKIGWDYYLDEQKMEVEVLPTAFAILALSIHGFEVTKQVEYLRSQLKKSELNDQAKFAETVFGIYALLIGTNDFDNNKEIYKEILNKIWNSPYRMMNNIIEQNVEYWFDTNHDYVRVPWQLYLLSITSLISDKKFYSVSTQRLLNTMIDEVLKESFKYQYSGHYVSSRTNAILYDTLNNVKNNIKGNIWHRFLIIVDAARTFLGGKVVRGILIGIGVLVFSISIIEWIKLYTTGDKNFSDIAPEFIGWIILSLVALGKRK